MRENGEHGIFAGITSETPGALLTVTEHRITHDALPALAGGARSAVAS
jgi:hypothetical protein